MKKIVLVGVIFFIIITACPYPMITISVQNDSNFSAVLNIDYTRDNRGIVELQPNEIKTFSLPSSYTVEMAIKQKNITRNHLSFLSSTKCVIENNLPVPYKIINTTKLKVRLEEKNNLFDTIEIDGVSGSYSYIEKTIDVYSSSLDIKAITLDYSIPLKLEIQDKKIIIKL